MGIKFLKEIEVKLLYTCVVLMKVSIKVRFFHKQRHVYTNLKPNSTTLGYLSPHRTQYKYQTSGCSTSFPKVYKVSGERERERGLYVINLESIFLFVF